MLICIYAKFIYALTPQLYTFDGGLTLIIVEIKNRSKIRESLKYAKS